MNLKKVIICYIIMKYDFFYFINYKIAKGDKSNSITKDKAPIQNTKIDKSDTYSGLTDDEEFVFKGFERLQDKFNSVIVKFFILNILIQKDENKQKQFNSKVIVLQEKLKKKDVKITLIRILIDFLTRIFIF